MGKRAISVAIILGAVIFVSVWASGVLKGILPDIDLDDDTPPPTDLDGFVEVEGYLYSSETGDPIVGADVGLQKIRRPCGPGSQVSTDTDGWYSVKVEIGSMCINIEATEGGFNLVVNWPPAGPLVYINLDLYDAQGAVSRDIYIP